MSEPDPVETTPDQGPSIEDTIRENYRKLAVENVEAEIGEPNDTTPTPEAPAAASETASRIAARRSGSIR